MKTQPTNPLVSETSKLSFSPITPLISAYVPQASLPPISQEVIVKLPAQVQATQATPSARQVMASVSRPHAQVTVKDVRSLQNHAQAVQLIISLLIQLAILPAIILSEPKH